MYIQDINHFVVIDVRNNGNYDWKQVLYNNMNDDDDIWKLD